MAQKIVTVCDSHQLRDEEESGFPWEIAITPPGGRRATFAVDLCEADGKPLQDLYDFLSEVARRLDHGPRNGKRGQRSPEEIRDAVAAGEIAAGSVCPIEGCEHRTTTEQALRSHVRDHHSLSLSEARGEPVPYACPAQGCGRAFSRKQGLAQHVRLSHGAEVWERHRAGSVAG
jgi:hypothetical protein